MMSLSAVQSLLACCLVLVVGRVLTTRVSLLERYSIPVPIVGGLLFSVLATMLAAWGNVQVALETTIRPTLLLIFFGCVGLTANLKLLARGGPRLIGLLLVLVPYLILQNAVGLGLAWLLDLHPLMGLIGGSITLLGGHGTSAAYAARFADINNIQDVMALAMTASTIGLVLGGVLGGPVGEWLIKRNKLAAGARVRSAQPEQAAGAAAEAPDTTAFITSLTAVFVTLVAGSYLAGLVENAPISLPNFLWCLATGILIRNLGPKVGFHLNDRVTDIVGSIALSLFLGLTMMTMDLSSVISLAGPLALMLAVQALVCALYSAWVVFRVLKRDYEGAVISAAFCGFGLGATATAIANMQALTRRHGPAPEAFIVVPVTGAFLVDILNVIVLTSFIALPFVGGM